MRFRELPIFDRIRERREERRERLSDSHCRTENTDCRALRESISKQAHKRCVEPPAAPAQNVQQTLNAHEAVNANILSVSEKQDGNIELVINDPGKSLDLGYTTDDGITLHRDHFNLTEVTGFKSSERYSSTMSPDKKKLTVLMHPNLKELRLTVAGKALTLSEDDLKNIIQRPHPAPSTSATPPPGLTSGQNPIPSQKSQHTAPSQSGPIDPLADIPPVFFKDSSAGAPTSQTEESGNNLSPQGENSREKISSDSRESDEVDPRTDSPPPQLENSPSPASEQRPRETLQSEQESSPTPSSPSSDGVDLKVPEVPNDTPPSTSGEQEHRSSTATTLPAPEFMLKAALSRALNESSATKSIFESTRLSRLGFRHEPQLLADINRTADSLTEEETAAITSAAQAITLEQYLRENNAQTLNQLALTSWESGGTEWLYSSNLTQVKRLTSDAADNGISNTALQNFKKRYDENKVSIQNDFVLAMRVTYEQNGGNLSLASSEIKKSIGDMVTKKIDDESLSAEEVIGMYLSGFQSIKGNKEARDELRNQLAAVQSDLDRTQPAEGAPTQANHAAKKTACQELLNYVDTLNAGTEAPSDGLNSSPEATEPPSASEE